MSDIFKDIFIFEMANNHQGRLEHGLNIIKEMAKIKRRNKIKAAVKLQYRDLDTFIHKDFKNRKDVKHIPRFMNTRLTYDDFLSMINEIHKEGLISIVTPFDEVSVSKCMDHGVQILKVGSCSATDWPLLEELAETKKPIIISTGGISIYEIDNIVSFFSHKDVEFSLMHCVGVYPTPQDILHMNFVSKLKKRYPYIHIGYSGHEKPDDYDVAKIAYSKGAEIFERHVGVETKEIKLNKYSMNPIQTENWVKSILIAKNICGDQIEKYITQSEIDSLLSLKRGVYVNEDIKAGSKIKNESVYFAMPCLPKQLSSGEFGQKRSEFFASKDYKRDEPIYEMAKMDKMKQIREIIHDAKGMIYEAHVELGNNYNIEISHHYGTEHFRQIGALIVNVVNREYCKKIIALLPAQKHPVHLHKKKEETFCMLWGDLILNLNDLKIKMLPGDQILIERGAKHSFTTINGAVFEEISTRHYSDDSFYDDKKISRLDPMERKTKLDSW